MEDIKGNEIFSLKPYQLWQLKGLIMGFLLILAVVVPLHQIINDRSISLYVLSSISFVWIIIWLAKNKIGKTKKNKLGIIICVYSNDPQTDEKVREDFVSSLEKSLTKNNIGNFSDIKVIPYHIALRYNSPDKSQKLLYKTRAEFIIHGIVRKRDKKHVMDLTANVLHTPLNDESSKRFQYDISAAWAHRYSINSEEHIIEGFEKSSEITSICSKYIIALAAFASYNFNNAEVLFIKVREEIDYIKLPDANSKIIIRTIKQNTKKRLNQIYILQMQLYLELWSETHDTHNISIMNEISNKLFGAYERNGQVLTYKAIIEVILTNKFNKALNFLYKIKKKHRDSVWHLNVGFLNASLGKEKDSINLYQKAIDINKTSPLPLQLEKIAEFENFICWYMKENDSPPFLFYLLGILNEYFKGDEVQAINDYNDFLKNNTKGDLNQLVKIVTNKLKDLS